MFTSWEYEVNETEVPDVPEALQLWSCKCLNSRSFNPTKFHQSVDRILDSLHESS